MWSLIRTDVLAFDDYNERSRKLYNTKIMAIQLEHPNIHDERFIENYTKNEDQIMNNAPLDFTKQLNVEEQQPTQEDLADKAEVKPSSKVSDSSEESISLQHSLLQPNDEANLIGEFEEKAKIGPIQGQESQAGSSTDGMLQALQMEVPVDDDKDEAPPQNKDPDVPQLTWQTCFSTWLGYGSSPQRDIPPTQIDDQHTPTSQATGDLDNFNSDNFKTEDDKDNDPVHVIPPEVLQSVQDASSSKSKTSKSSATRTISSSSSERSRTPARG